MSGFRSQKNPQKEGYKQIPLPIMTSYKVLTLSDFTFSSFHILTGFVTPDLASELLKRNMENNRKLSPALINKYVREMQEDSWLVAEPIKFSSDGELIDGQHRLSSVIKSGIACPFVIITGYPKKSAEVLDQGKKRDASDIASIRGVLVHKTAISIVRATYEMANNPTGIGGYPPLASRNVATVASIYKDRLDFACSYRNKGTAINSSAVLSVVFAAYPYENHQRLLEFLECWHTGQVVKGKEDNAAMALRNYYLAGNRATSSRSRRIELFGKAQSALKAFLSNKHRDFVRGTDKILWSLDEFKHETLMQKIKEFESNP